MLTTNTRQSTTYRILVTVTLPVGCASSQLDGLVSMAAPGVDFPKVAAEDHELYEQLASLQKVYNEASLS